MRLNEKVALVTGAASGIGRESALLFAKEGARVVLVDVDDTHGEETRKMIEAEGGTSLYVHADISDGNGCNKMVEAAEKQFGRLDILFNNAGIMLGMDDDAVNTKEEVWEKTMAVNLKGVFLGCKYGIPALRRAGGGSVRRPLRSPTPPARGECCR
jgi:NAD(P)-dependent dehydrogenase (short-subunit alcohol dehydrogenase family)